MGLSRSDVRRSVAKKKARSKIVSVKPRQRSKGNTLTVRHASFLLSGLYQHTKGKCFKPQALREWLRQKGTNDITKQWQVPTLEAARLLLEGLCKNPLAGRGVKRSAGTWHAEGVRYMDPDDAAVHTLDGFERGIRTVTSKQLSWHEHGHDYSLQKVEGECKGAFRVVRVAGVKRVGCLMEKKDIADFKNVIVLNPRKISTAVPKFSIIWLHSFSLRGLDYKQIPQYFGISDAAVRVVLPTAPKQQQSCFDDWNEWRGDKLGWRRIRFHSWFDYLTDRAGSSENDLDTKTLVDMRARIHELIRLEVQRMGGDARRVLIGGCSQGACVAIDAAMTYPEVLGGVIGCVGHIMGCTPLDPAKRSMPMYLFHETGDKEMRWRWVQGTVQRLVDNGFNVHLKRERDPEGSGHWIHTIEGEWITEGLRGIAASSRSPA